MRQIAIAFAALLVATGAFASDLPRGSQAPVYKAPQPPVGCTPTKCDVWTISFQLDGHATNMDVIGNGVNGSILAGGATPELGLARWTWDGNYAYGVAAACGYSFNVSGPAVQGYDCWQEFQLGGNLAALFSQTPANPPQGLAAAIMFPYAAVGPEERQHGTGWRAGAGLKFFLNSSTFLDAGYRAFSAGNMTVGNTVQKTDNITYIALHKAIPSLFGF